jgi:electron transfer flavoprotein beta subunit
MEKPFMKMIACVKQVPYPDTPASAYGVHGKENRILLPEDVPLVLSPFDENALEAGLQLREKTCGSLTVVSLAVRQPEVVIRDLKQALAMGADEAVLLDDPGFQGGDSASTAYTLARAVEKIGEYDLVLCGIQAADWDGGQVGLGLAEILGIPAAGSVNRIEPGDGFVRVWCIIENGVDVLELPTPCVLAVASDEALTPRIAPLPGIIKAKKRKIPVWSAADLETDPALTGAVGARTVLERLELPSFEGSCEFLSGGNPAEAAVKLAERLREENIL